MEKIKQLHQYYFAKDQLLRHTAQHFIVSVFIALLLQFLFKINISIDTSLLLLFFTYLPDLDGTLSCFIHHKTNPTASLIRHKLLNLQIKEALTHGTKHHKQLDRLIVHNNVIYPMLWLVFIFAIVNHAQMLIIIFAALLGHFTFDQLDDLVQLGHIHNWLWPYRVILGIK